MFAFFAHALKQGITLGQEVDPHGAPSRQQAVGVVLHGTVMLLCQVIQQHVTRTDIEAALANRHIGDAAEVQAQIVDVEQVVFSGRHQWRTLAAKDDVLVSDVDRQGTWQVCRHGFAVADLECEPVVRLGEDREAIRVNEINFKFSFVDETLHQFAHVMTVVYVGMC